MQKLLIADSSEEFSLVLAGSLRTAFQVECCTTGDQALTLLRSLKPDILLLDLMMPELDGLEILRSVKEEQLCRCVIVTSAFASDYLLESIRELPVDYFYRKPCSVASITDRIADLAARIGPGRTNPDPHCAVSSTLLALNIPTHKKGFRYARCGILMLAGDPDLQVTKEVYPAIAKEFSTSTTAVEKSIRGAIDSAWETHDPAVWRRYFHPAANGRIPRPTNTQFLSRLADVVASYTQKQA